MAGSSATVSRVAVSGAAVTLTLAAAVTGGQTVTLDYTPGANPIRDAARNAAAALSGQAVTNNTPIPNNPATGAPSIGGTERVGEVLTAALGDIADDDGLPATFPDDYALQWIRVDGGSEDDISGATSTAYTLVAADEGKTLKVRASFTDDAGHEESRTSAATGTIAEADDNSPATGAPTIGGEELEGRTLTASTAGIADADGLTRVGYSYLWIRVDGGTEAELATATASSYELESEDVGKTLKVRVSFQDDAGNDETLESAQTGVIAADTTAPMLVSAEVNGTRLTLVFDEFLRETYPPPIADISLRDSDNNSIAAAGTSRPTGSQAIVTLATGAVPGRTYFLHYAGRTHLFSYADRFDNYVAAISGHPVTNNTPIPNNPATGAPSIGGTERVGEALTAALGDIADDDGLPTTFPDDYALQWIRVDGGSEDDISGATSATYTLVAADEGKMLKVRVSFTDDAGHEESRTSAATGTIPALGANAPATGAPSIGGTERVGEVLTAALGDIADDDGLPTTFPDDYALQWIRVDGGSEDDISGATSTAYTLVAADEGNTLKVRVSFTDDAGHEESRTSAATGTIAAVLPTLSIADATFAEDAGAVSVSVTLSEASASEVTVDYAGEDGTATAGDYTVVAGTLRIAAGNTSGSVPVTIVDDAIDEDDEAFAVTLSNPSNAVLADDPTEAAVTITDDDTRGVSISDSTLTVAEDASDTYTVVLQSQPTGGVTVTPSVTGDADVTFSPATLSFTATDWDTPKPVTVSAAADADAVDDTATIAHAVTGGDYASVTAAGVAVTVTDDETASTAVALTLSESSVAEDSGSTTITVTGTLDEAALTADAVVTVAVGATGDGATEGEDYAAVADLTLTIAEGDTSATVDFTLTVTDDDVDEDNEAVTVSGTTGAPGLTVTGSALTIADDDTRGVSVSDSTLTVAEDASDTYTVVLQSQPTGEVTVTPSVTGDADVTFSPATLSFTATDWNTPKPVTVSAAADADAVDDTATIAHAVTGGDYASVTAAGVAVTVTDDETASTAVALTLSESSVAEDSGSTTIAVTGTLDESPRTTDTVVTVSVGAAGDSATEGTDYATVADFPLTIAAGATTGTASFTLAVTDDDVDEDAESLTVGGTAGGLTVTGATLTINDNDTRAVAVSTAALAVPEGGTATYTLVLQSEPTGPVTVTPSVSGSADVTVSGALTFTAGNWDTSQTVTVSAAEDADADADQATVNHAVAGADYGSVTAGTVAVTVSDNDSASTGITLGLSVASVSENAGSQAVSVTGTLNGAARTVPTSVTVSVGAAGDSAVEGTDYATVADFTLTIAAGATTGAASFTLAVIDDDVDENAETLTVGGTAGALTVTGGALTINDNDTRGVTVSVASLTVGEGETGAYTVVLDTEPTGPVTVTPSVSGSADVTVSGALTFAADNWDTAQTVTVSAAQDTDAEDDAATVAHTLTGGDYGPVTAASVAVTVSDDETVTTAVALSLDTDSLTEGTGQENVTVTGTLDGAPRAADTAVTVSVGAAGDLAVEGTDYATVPDFTLVIAAGATTGTASFTLAVTDDDVDENAETLTVGGTAGGLTVTGGALTINDNDTRGVTVSEPSLALAEGESGAYTVVLDTEPTGPVTVTPSVSGSADVTVSPVTLTFTPGDWDTAQTLTVSAAQDADAQDDEAAIAHTLTGGDYASVTAPEVAVTVRDGDVASEGISLEVDTDSVAEGTGLLTIRVTASLDGAASASDTVVTLSVGADGDSATEGEDYAAVDDLSVTIVAGASSATVDFILAVTDDAIDEDGESLTVSGTAEGLAVSGTAIAIVDNDMRGVTVSAASLTVEKGQSATYTVVLDSEPTGTVTVTPSVSDNAHATVSPEFLTFTAANWNMAQQVTVSLSAEAASTAVTVSHTVSGSDYESETVEEVTVDPEDPDPVAVTLSVEPASAAEDAGTADVTVTASLDGPARAADTEIAVSVGADGDSATEGGDYAAVADFTLTVAAGATTGTASFALAVVDDAIDDDGESLTVSGTGEGLAVTGTAIAIADNDMRGVTVSAASLTVEKGQSATYTVVLDSEPTGTVTVTPSVSDNAHATVSPEFLTFTAANWNMAQQVTVSLSAEAASTAVTVSHTVSGSDYESETVEDVAVDPEDPRPDPVAVTLSVEPSSVAEDAGAVTVEVSAALTGTVRESDIEIAVSVGTATDSAGSGGDYSAVADFVLTIAAGRNSGSASFTLTPIDDREQEEAEVLTVAGATSAQDVTIEGAEIAIEDNDEPSALDDFTPEIWLTRFGRAATDQALGAIGARFRGEAAESHVTLAGRRVDNLVGQFAGAEGASGSAHGGQGLAGVPGGSCNAAGCNSYPAAGAWPLQTGAANRGSPGIRAAGAPAGAGGGGPGGFAGALGLPDLRNGLMNSSFSFSQGGGGAGTAQGGAAGSQPGPADWTLWGQMGATEFEGEDGPLSLTGNVNNAMLGADLRRGRWLAGAAVSHALGEGQFARPGVDAGTVKSTLTSLHPYAFVDLGERSSLWAAAGYGQGTLELQDGNATAIETDLNNVMAAFGGRGVLSTGGALELALVSDARWTRTESDAALLDSISLAGGSGSTSRVRLLLEGSGSVLLKSGAVLTPSLEAGLRYDGGDAETGRGVEVGGGLAFAAGRLSIDLSARMLVGHEDAAYEEWGASGLVAYRAGEDGRGLSVNLGSSWGAAQSGIHALWSRETANGIASGSPVAGAPRLDLELGYGLAGKAPESLWVPYLSAQRFDELQSLLLGMKLTRGTRFDAALSLGVDRNSLGESHPSFELGGRMLW